MSCMQTIFVHAKILRWKFSLLIIRSKSFAQGEILSPRKNSSKNSSLDEMFLFHRKNNFTEGSEIFRLWEGTSCRT